MGGDNNKATKPSRSAAFLFIGVFTLVVGIYAFWPYIINVANYPSIVTLHAIIMLGWLLIFIGQVYFAWSGQIGRHIMLGKVV